MELSGKGVAQRTLLVGENSSEPESFGKSRLSEGHRPAANRAPYRSANEQRILAVELLPEYLHVSLTNQIS
jgi:hypothetical protein